MVFGEGITPDNDGTARNPNTNDSHPATSQTPARTRRELREREHRVAVTASAVPAPVARAVSTPAAVPARPGATPARAQRPRATVRALATGAVMTLAAGLVATMALPSYAFTTGDGFDPQAATAPLTLGQQSLIVGASSSAGAINRDGYTAPTEGDLAAARAAADAAAARARVAASAATSTASRANNFVINPPSASYSGAAVVAYAKQFVGVVPYGTGASPDTSFGCDGLTQYVFAQFGISLPRMVSNQAASGIRVSPEDAQAGDLVVWPIGHIGIYDGNGRSIDAPDWGRYVEHRPLWGSYYFVRIVG